MSLEDDFDVYVAADKAEALEVLWNDHIDVMVTDLRLGADDGMEVIEAALQMPKPPICLHHDDGLWVVGRGGGGDEARCLRFCHQAAEHRQAGLIKRALKERGQETEIASLKRQVTILCPGPAGRNNRRRCGRCWKRWSRWPRAGRRCDRG